MDTFQMRKNSRKTVKKLKEIRGKRSDVSLENGTPYSKIPIIKKGSSWKKEKKTDIGSLKGGIVYTLCGDRETDNAKGKETRQEGRGASCPKEKEDSGLRATRAFKETIQFRC